MQHRFAVNFGILRTELCSQMFSQDYGSGNIIIPSVFVLLWSRSSIKLIYTILEFNDIFRILSRGFEDKYPPLGIIVFNIPVHRQGKC